VKGRFWEIVNLLDIDTESQRDLITIELVFPYFFCLFLSFAGRTGLRFEFYLMAQIEIGMRFGSWESLKETVQDWAIEEHFQFRITVKDLTRVDYRCRHKGAGCSWRVYASINKQDEIEAKRVQVEHTCAGGRHTAREVSNSQSWLRRMVPQHLCVTRTTETHEIVDCIRLHYNVRVNYESARLVKAALVKDRRDYQSQQFTKIPAYIELLKATNPETFVQFQTTALHNNEQVFQRIFICPHESKQSFTSMRKFMAVDGTFLKARFVQTLLLAVGIDGNGHNLLLAWSIVESENKDSWTWFLTCLKTSIPECVGMTLISDRDKGLLAADELVFGDGINRLICCFHLKGNLCKRFGGHLSAAFWGIANARTIHEFEERKNDLRLINASAASYLD